MPNWSTGAPAGDHDDLVLAAYCRTDQQPGRHPASCGRRKYTGGSNPLHRRMIPPRRPQNHSARGVDGLAVVIERITVHVPQNRPGQMQFRREPLIH
jgi:hypothetical protein